MKKTRKRGLAWLMTLAMIVSLLPMVAWAEEPNFNVSVVIAEDLDSVWMGEVYDFEEFYLNEDLESVTIDTTDEDKYPETIENDEGKVYYLQGIYDYEVEDFIDSVTVTEENWIKWSDGVVVIYLPTPRESSRVGSASKTDYYNITATIEAFDAEGNSVGYLPLGNISLLTKDEKEALNSAHDAYGLNGTGTGKTVAVRTNVREDTELRVVLDIYEGNHDYIFQGFRLKDNENYLEDQENTDKYADIAEKREAAFEVNKDMELIAVFAEEPGKGQDREFGELKITGGDYVCIPKEIIGENYYPVIVLFEDGDYTVSMDADTEVAKEEHLLVFDGTDADITLDNVQMEMDVYAIEIEEGDTKVDLILKGTNRIEGYREPLKAKGIVGFLLDEEDPGTLTMEMKTDAVDNELTGKLMHDDIYVWAGKDEDSAKLVASGTNAEFTGSDLFALPYLYITPYNGETYEYFDFNNAADKFFTDEEIQNNSSGELFDWFERRMEENGISSKGKLNALKEFAAEKWGGSCFGFSAVAAMFHTEEMDLNELRLFDENATGIPDTTMPKEDTDVRDLLNYYLVLQALPEVRGTMRYMNKADDQQYLLQLAERLARATDAGTDDPVMFLYFMGNGSGHAVTLDGAVRNADGSYTVMVEDNRFFGQELATDVDYRNGAIYGYKLTGQDINPVLEISKDGKKAVMTFEGGWTTANEKNFSKYGAFKEVLTRYEVITNYELLKDYFPGEYVAPEDKKAPKDAKVIVIDKPIFWFPGNKYVIIDPGRGGGWQALPLNPGDGDEESGLRKIVDNLRRLGYWDGDFEVQWGQPYRQRMLRENLIAGTTVSVDENLNAVMEYAPATTMAEVEPAEQYAAVNPDGTIAGRVAYAEGDIYSRIDTAKADAAVFDAEGAVGLAGNEGEFEITVTRNGGDELARISGDAIGNISVVPTEDGITAIIPAGIYQVTFIDKDGKETVQSFTTEGGLASIGTDGAVEVPEMVPASELPFTDVKANDWFYNAVKYVYENGLMSGTSETTFSPAVTTSRGMITSILWRMEGRPDAAAEVPFADVAKGAYYAEAIAWAAENGIVSGYDADTFGPNDPITREQLASILFRYAKFKGYDVSVGENTNILSYKDAEEISEYAIPAMQWACGAGIMSGNTDGTLNPDGQAQRSHAAQMLMKFGENVK